MVEEGMVVGEAVTTVVAGITAMVEEECTTTNINHNTSISINLTTHPTNTNNHQTST